MSVNFSVHILKKFLIIISYAICIWCRYIGVSILCVCLYLYLYILFYLKVLVMNESIMYLHWVNKIRSCDEVCPQIKLYDFLQWKIRSRFIKKTLCCWTKYKIFSNISLLRWFIKIQERFFSFWFLKITIVYTVLA